MRVDFDTAYSSVEVFHIPTRLATTCKLVSRQISIVRTVDEVGCQRLIHILINLELLRINCPVLLGEDVLAEFCEGDPAVHPLH